MVRYKRIFVVSHNKCGTTTLGSYFKGLGENVCPQSLSEDVAYRYIDSRLKPDIKLLKPILKFSVFQDTPFSRKEWLPILLEGFPNAGFIYIHRESDDWYQSLVFHHFYRFYGIEPRFNNAGSVRWNRRLSRVAAQNLYRNRSLVDNVTQKFGTSRYNPYKKSALIDYHQQHSAQALRLLTGDNHLVGRFRDLVTGDFASQLADFLGLSFVPPLPHENARLSEPRET